MIFRYYSGRVSCNVMQVSLYRLHVLMLLLARGEKGDK